MKKIIAIFSATIELIASLLSPPSAAELPEEPASFTESVTIVEALPEVEAPEPSPTLGPAPQDENGNYIGPGTATMEVYFIVE